MIYNEFGTRASGDAVGESGYRPSVDELIDPRGAGEVHAVKGGDGTVVDNIVIVRH